MPIITISPTQSNIIVALRTFLVSILPQTTSVIQGQQNRVPEPANSDFVTMTVMRRERISTNLDTYSDSVFTGSIAANLLTISAVTRGSIHVGDPVSGVGITPGTVIAARATGTGGVGTYTILPVPQTVPSGKIAVGIASFRQAMKLTFQLEIHGPNSPDNAQTISTLFRDDYAVQQFAASGFDITPMYADDPRQVPFQNGEEQYETRYIIEAALQANQVVSGIPQQFADQLDVTLVDIANEYRA